ncbi:5775_t:CDS:2, partial [Racocetra persica]
MRDDLLEGIIENEEVSENEDNNLSNEYEDEDFNEIIHINNMERGSVSLHQRFSIVASPSSSRFSTLFSDILQEDNTIKENSISQTNKSSLTPPLNSRFSVQFANTMQGEISVIEEHELEIANKNLKDYRSKMKHQMHTKYNIHERVYEVVFAVLSRNMYCLVCRFGILDQSFPAGVVLLLGPKEFSELDNPPTNITVTALQQDVVAKKQILYVEVDVIQKIQSVSTELK